MAAAIASHLKGISVLAVDDESHKSILTTPDPPNGTFGRNAQGAWWETLPYGSLALKALSFPSRSTMPGIVAIAVVHSVRPMLVA